MANTAQARKRARQSVKTNLHNAALRSEMRTAMKKITKAIESGDKAAATAAFNENVSVLDRIADKKIIHKNKAARHKSRLNAKIKAMAGDAPKVTKAKKPAATKTAEKKPAAAKKPAAKKAPAKAAEKKPAAAKKTTTAKKTTAAKKPAAKKPAAKAAE